MKQRNIKYTGQFKKDVKLAEKRGLPVNELKTVLTKLINDQFPLPPEWLDHPLTGPWKGYRDIHIQPDWLLLYKISDTELIFARTGTHSDLLKK
ncbi:type II toxin-antitoxin system YafQ family toxin [Salmonella enterica]|nr:type II toxin-antitoxin system YafQ family toxin [Salmonella enterica subsp. enterica]ELC4346617.1 type II toxin-antitoxin system YafQ family toxin [Salmonella enterica]ELF4914200.1 type II toxin-antitoxin system YafQ family toxin [Salmonella enterica]